MGNRAQENTGFTCLHCGREVTPLTNGSYRNHCPYCLHSRHVDDEPGDRASGCGGVMVPASVRYHTKKGYQILHRCVICGREQWNISAAGEDDLAGWMACINA